MLPATAWNRITAVFVAQSWSGEPHNAEPDEHEGLFWVPMEKPPPDCHPYTAAIFHMLTHAAHGAVGSQDLILGADRTKVRDYW
jgi:hypothetical protein